MPAAVIVLLVLASLSVDQAVVWLAERELVGAAADAADDAATYGLDEAWYRATGEYRLDPARVDAAVRAALAARHSAVVDQASVTIDIDEAAATVRITLVSSARRVFAPAVGGGRDVTVDAASSARAELRN